MNRQSQSTFLLIFGSFAAIFLLCFGDALFGGGQFGYRDAGHFYYPLYRRVQAEWDAGRWPLWEPEENSGMPLLGNPTAAVLYPGKLIYALFPYPWAARLYILAHMVLAFVAMLVPMRSWGVSWDGFGHRRADLRVRRPVLFQYCNIIYLVGAAWLPLGFLAVDALAPPGQPLGDPGAGGRAGHADARRRPPVRLSARAVRRWLRGGAGLGRRGRRAPDTRSSTAESPARPRRWWLDPRRRARPRGLGRRHAGAGRVASQASGRQGPAARPPVDASGPARRRGGLGPARAGFALAVAEHAAGGRRWAGCSVGLAARRSWPAALAAAQLLPVIEFTQQTVAGRGRGAA